MMQKILLEVEQIPLVPNVHVKIHLRILEYEQVLPLLPKVKTEPVNYLC